MSGYTQQEVNEFETFIDGIVNYMTSNTRFAEDITRIIGEMNKRLRIQSISIWLLIICIWLLIFLK